MRSAVFSRKLKKKNREETTPSLFFINEKFKKISKYCAWNSSFKNISELRFEKK